MSEFGEQEFRRRYPGLAFEMGGPGTIKIDAVRTGVAEAERATHSVLGYQPAAVDFIRRCDDEGQALQIINFLEARGELLPTYAERLRAQLIRDGLRSFGPKKNPGYYEGCRP